MSLVSEAPKSLRPTLWVGFAVVSVLTVAGVAYGAVTRRAEEVVNPKIAVLTQRQDDADKRFERVERALERIETKLDKLRR